MILVLKAGLNAPSVSALLLSLERLGLAGQHIEAAPNSYLAVSGDTQSMPTHVFSQLDGVEKVFRVQQPFPLAQHRSQSRILLGGTVTIGSGTPPVIMAGPCSVEGELQIEHLARIVAESGGKLLRGGAFKPRSSPYDFQGLGKQALTYLARAKESTGLPIVSEVMSAEQLEWAEEIIDVLQIGARNMYNYELLRQVGKSRRPVLLKRAMSATISEFLQAAEYILLGGNENVILCERGIRTFETHTRNTLDLNAVAALKQVTALPVVVDPSHGTGRRELVRPLSRAAIACGADGLLIEIHADPAKAMSDGGQAITPDVLREIVDDANAIYNILAKDDGRAIVSVATQPPVSALI